MEFKIGFHHGKQGKLTYEHPVYLNPTIYIDNTGDIEIGKGVSISRNVRIYTHQHYHDGHTVEEDIRTKRIEVTSLIIGDDVYIYDGVIILPSVNFIGYGSVIGAGSVVTCDIPAGEVWAGNPAKFIRKIK